jgi:hypothetical protein
MRNVETCDATDYAEARCSGFSIAARSLTMQSPNRSSTVVRSLFFARHDTKLQLGPVPNAQNIKNTIGLTAELKELLDRYAELHSQLNGNKNDTTRLIPYMLESFMARGRVFRSVW